MSLFYYSVTPLPAASTALECNGCGAVLAYYPKRSALYYGL